MLFESGNGQMVRVSAKVVAWLAAKHNRRPAMDLRISTVFWKLLILSLVISYVVIAAGVLGFLPAHTVSLVTLIGAMIGCVAALGFIVSAQREFRAR
jgi:hypothetical protein